MINTEEINYKEFGKCVRLTNGIIELVVTLEVGPRIIRFSRVGGENVFFEDGKRTINHNDNRKEYEDFYGEGVTPWAILGGHRLWAAPEAMPRTYTPDCRSVYEQTENGIKVIAPLQKATNLKPEVEITIIGDNEVKVLHSIRNCGAWPTEFSVWAISVCDTGSVEIVPQPKRFSGYLHNRAITLWHYSNMADERITWGEKYIALKQDKNNFSAFKFGINNEDGYALCFNHKNLFVKKFDMIADGNYPDGGASSYESYTNEHFVELESLGELKTVKPGEASEHIEYWKLFENVDVPRTDSEIDDIVKKYV